MGYFNYFIKCIIRNFAYKLCKPKVFLTVLLCCLVLFGLHTKGYCAWDDSDISALTEQLNSVIDTLNNQSEWLVSIGVDVGTIQTDIANIRNSLNNINTNTANISSYISGLLGKVDTVNSTLASLYAQQNTQYQSIKNELSMIRESLNGVKNEPTSYTFLGTIPDSASQTHQSVKGIKIDYDEKYTYKVVLTCYNTWDSVQQVRVATFNNPLANGFNYSSLSSNFLYLGVLPSKTTVTITYNVPSSNPEYIYFTFAAFINRIEVYRSINGITESLNQNNDLQQQGNQLQQESNQLQQEQNDFLQQGTSDNDVSVDNFNNVDSNDITSSGLTGIFTTIYNSINSWSSKDIVLPIPFTNKSLTIPANYTNNMLGSVGGGSLITIISTVYYFIVARFIVYSITGIINSIKSGSILETDTKNNITTEML